jgi:mRNA-degrading endonuclease YafQ of YafQ-DinJ toxin-antitoxin module
LKRLLLPSSAFIRDAKRFLRNHPQFGADVQLTLELLESDAFHPRLKTHKLKGRLSGSWACSAGYDLRIIFQFVKHRGKDALLLEGIGTHDEVY